MKLRPLGNTGINVSEIGLGAWQLANPDWDVDSAADALQIVQQSFEAGCNFFDSAPAYGRGVSEEVLGRALKPIRQQVVLCTKFGHSPEGVTSFAPEALAPSVEGSLRRLQTDYVDVLLVHNPPRALMDGRQTDLYAALEQLKAQGKVRAYGVSLDWKAELETVVATTRSQAVEVMYNVLYQEPVEAFPRAQQGGVGLIVKVPLDSGWLSGRYRQDAQFTDVRRRWPREVIARRAQLVEQFAAVVPPGTSLAHAALQFILARPEISTLIPGAKTVAQALDNFAAAERTLPEATVQALCELWQRDIQADPLPW